jgi:hypothetical protein
LIHLQGPGCTAPFRLSLLSLALPSLGSGEYRRASGLTCALWALAGLRLAQRREYLAVGPLLLGGLGLKLAAEAAPVADLVPSASGPAETPVSRGWTSPARG